MKTKYVGNERYLPGAHIFLGGCRGSAVQGPLDGKDGVAVVEPVAAGVETVHSNSGEFKSRSLLRAHGCFGGHV